MRKTHWYQLWLLSALILGLWWAPLPVRADTACGPGWTCVGTNTYLEVVNCTTRFGDYCANLELRSTQITCPTGGGAGSCVNNNAPGLNGCHKIGEAQFYDCICGDYVTQCPAKIHDSPCPDSVIYKCTESPRTCTAAEEGQPCSGDSEPYTDICVAETTSQVCTCKTQDPICEPQPGSIGCCANTCNSSCVGKCGQVNDCGDLCPPCGTQVCGDSACTGTETCTTCSQDCGGCCGQNGCIDPGETCQTCALDCGACPPTPVPSPSPTTPPSPPPQCGDGDIDPGETCLNCPADVGPCCGDGLCNGTETCSSCAGDCGSCCGNGLCNIPPQTPAEDSCTCSSDCGSSCGNGICDACENTISCPADCDSCGNGICDGFEACDICMSDCGLCPTEVAWWQVAGGHVYAGGKSGYVLYSDIPSTTFCITPECIASLITADFSGDTSTAGIPMTGGGGIEANSYLTQRPENSFAIGTTSNIKENYTYFVRAYGMETASPHFPSNTNDAEKPPALGVDERPYLIEGDLVIDTHQWQVVDGETIVIFVTGNLIFRDTTHLEQLIDVEPGGFLAFIVQGDMTVEASVGNVDLDDTTANIEGVFIADGTLRIESRGEAAGGDDRFVGEGTFVSWASVELQRDFSDGGVRQQENNTRPTEMFVYRPDFVEHVPDRMKRTHYVWQETN